MSIPARNLTSGHPVLALDSMPFEYNTDGNDQDDVTSTIYIPWVPEVSATFEAPTSGRVLIVIGGGLNTFETTRLQLAPEVRVRDVNGGIIKPPNTSLNAWTSSGFDDPLNNPQFGCQVDLLEGLVPGNPYFVRAMVSVSGGTTNRFTHVNLFAVPTG